MRTINRNEVGIRQTIFVLKPKLFWNNITLVYSYGIKYIQYKKRKTNIQSQQLNPDYPHKPI